MEIEIFKKEFIFILRGKETINIQKVNKKLILEFPNIYKKILDYTKDFNIHPELNNLGTLCKLWFYKLPNPICKECGKPIKKLDRLFCCIQCRNKNKELIEISKKSSIEKYGVSHYSKTTEFREKIKEITPFKNKDKIKEAIFKKYGVYNVSKIPEIKEKSTKTFIKNFRKTNNISKEKFLEFKNNDFLDFEGLANRYNWSHLSLSQPRKWAKKLEIDYNNRTNTSVKEREILSFIKDNYSGKIITNDRNILNGLELDIYLPELKLAFEYNGLYWHSYGLNNISKKQNDMEFQKNRHLDKIIKCSKRDIELIHIFENQLYEDLILTKIKSYRQFSKFELKCYKYKNNVISEAFEILIPKYLSEHYRIIWIPEEIR